MGLGSFRRSGSQRSRASEVFLGSWSSFLTSNGVFPSRACCGCRRLSQQMSPDFGNTYSRCIILTRAISQTSLDSMTIFHLICPFYILIEGFLPTPFAAAESFLSEERIPGHAFGT